MTPSQVLSEIRQELGVNTRLAELIKTYAKHKADESYRSTRNQTEPSSLLYLTSFAHGVEALAEDITKPVQPNRTGSQRIAKE